MRLLKKMKIDTTLLLTLLVILVGYILIHDLLGGTLFAHSEWDSYTLQAMAWRQGRMDLEQNYAWLELAIFQGKYFVSFPPVPSLVMVPLTYLFGAQTPNNFIMVVYSLMSVSAAYFVFVSVGMKKNHAAFFATFVVLGSNMMWMSTNGGVWFQAQSLNMLLCLLAILAVLKKRRALGMTLVALAVGCRPFSICLFPVFLVYFCLQDKAETPDIPLWKIILKQWKTLIIPALIGASYMAYNYARFADPMEFGHNYLPEFSGDTPQFGLYYALENLGNIFRPIFITGAGILTYPTFNGFLFFVANPFFLLFFAQIIRDVKSRSMTKTKIACIVFLLMDLFLLLVHKTFGGWQFGARYTVDLLPFALFYMLLNGKHDVKRWEVVAGILALMFNIYGALAMTFLHA